MFEILCIFPSFQFSDLNKGSFINIFKGEGVGTSNFTTTTGHFFHYIESVFLVHHYYDIRTSKSVFLVDHYIKIDKDHNVKVVEHYYKNQNVKKNEKNIESLSFVWFSKLFYLWRKYLWRFGVNK